MLAVSSASGRAAEVVPLCAAAAAPVAASAALAQSVRAAFGAVSFTARGEGCTYPVTVLDYGGTAVLLTTRGVPGEGCHGCMAHLSAHVLRRTPDGLRRLATLTDVAEGGSSGSPGRISALKLGGDDGFAVESGGTFQGYSFTDLDIYLFRRGRVVHLAPDRRIILSADDRGAQADPAEKTAVVGTWTVDPAPGGVAIAYRVEKHGRVALHRTLWALEGARLRLVAGTVPPEAAAAAGR